MSGRQLYEAGAARGEWWHVLPSGRVQCDLCPRYCTLDDGQRGFCFVREARGGGMVLTAYGRASGYCIDPIEKKPLYHYYPGSSVLSFGTAGCNLGCRFCQNWQISKARETDTLSRWASPEEVTDTALASGCRGIAYTYNDPIVFAEYAIDCAIEGKKRGLHSVAVSSGYMSPKPREAFYRHMDAANIDLKAFTEEFYRKQCFAHLEPVLDTLCWLKQETNVWLEVTTLLIPGLNDSEDELDRMTDWFVEELGVDTPWHFSAFFPAFKLRRVPPTPLATLRRARRRARDKGIRYVYLGNAHDPEGEATYCGGCGKALIERDVYSIARWNVDVDGCCRFCGRGLKGHFGGAPGRWGSRREPVQMHERSHYRGNPPPVRARFH